MERKKYPIRAEDYQLREPVGQGVSASVYRALCIPLDEVVAIKVVDFERNNSDLNNICREAQIMILIDHPNVLKAHCSFVNDHNLWVVMPYMEEGSCLHIMKSAYPNGFKESVIATVLREVLKGLEYLHHQGHIHRDVKAGNILVDARGGIKLGDFGVSACLFDSGNRQRSRNTFVGTPCWMAPEVMEQLHGYDFKADIWSFGITALELAHGHAPFSKYPPIKALLMNLQNAPPGLDYESDKKFSKSFRDMIAICMVKDPSKRPTAHKLLKQPFFKQARSQDYIVRKILDGLPTLGDRHQALKEKEEDLLAQKKMLDSDKEALSQREYKRGISAWNFDVEDLKAQASSILENNETTGSNGCQMFGIHALQERISESASCSSKDDDDDVKKEVLDESTLSLPYQPACYQRIVNELILVSPKKQNQHENIGNDNGEFQTATDIPTEVAPKSSKSIGVEDAEDKSKHPLVQLKGRFKVMSENVDSDKAFAPICPQKGQSTQMEAATEREKQLIQEICDLHWRLSCTQDELKRLRARNAQANPLCPQHD
ncbi:unnamed protein product [Musa hybrid cultivar]